MRFTTDTHLDPEPIHLLKSDTPGIPPEAHLGILRNHHTYSADVPIPHSLGKNVSASHGPHNIHIAIMDVPETTKQGDSNPKYISLVKVQAKTIKEGSISEKIEIFTDEGDRMEILVTAKVLKANQGNPLLKNGIHVLSHEHTDESDFTEWPGFTGSKDDEEN